MHFFKDDKKTKKEKKQRDRNSDYAVEQAAIQGGGQVSIMTGVIIGDEAVVNGNINGSSSKNSAPQVSITKGIKVGKKGKLNRNIGENTKSSSTEDEQARNPVKHPEYDAGKLLVLYINVESNAMPKKVRSGTKKEFRNFKKAFKEIMNKSGQEVEEDMKADATKKDVEDGFDWIHEELSDNPDEFGGVVIFISCHSNKKESIVLVDCDDFKIETVINPLRNKMNELRIGAEKSQLPLVLIHQHCGGDALYDFTWNDTFAYFACLADEKAIRLITPEPSGVKENF